MFILKLQMFIQQIKFVHKTTFFFWNQLDVLLVETILISEYIIHKYSMQNWKYLINNSVCSLYYNVHWNKLDVLLFAAHMEWKVEKREIEMGHSKHNKTELFCIVRIWRKVQLCAPSCLRFYGHEKNNKEEKREQERSLLRVN